MQRVFAALLLLVALVAATTTNNRPIIGILAQPNEAGKTYLAASYVKWMESAGARVVAIPYTLSFETHKSLFASLNGILFPGGGAPLTNTSRYMEVMNLYFDLTIQANEKGDYFPLWATCLGFEAISILASKNYNVLDKVDAWNISLPLELTSDYKNSKLFASCPNDVVDIVKSQAVTLNNHHWSVYSSVWNKNSNLNKFYKVLSVNKDRNGVEFISTIEANQYPIYGSQWHPEKVQFEWIPAAINHSADSVKANAWFAWFFVNEARKNAHRFPNSQEEWNSLIYHHNPTFTYPNDFTQTYYF